VRDRRPEPDVPSPNVHAYDVIEPSESLEPAPFSVTAAPVLPETLAPAFAIGDGSPP
jgi:hypothetical protein